MNSDQIVESLQPFGVVMVFQNDNKLFWAKAELFMHGMKAEVHSSHKHPTMLSALTELQSNVFAVVNVGVVNPALERLK